MQKYPGMTLVIFIMIGILLLTACAPAAAPPAVVETSAVPITVVTPPTATAAPVVEPTAPPVLEERTMILATTTSTDDSGLLDFILPDFEALCGCQINVVVVGSGQALQLGIDGNADVLLVHSPAKEQEFMANGHGTRREDVMYNDFVILGPAEDPAGVGGSESAAEALQLIAAAEETFISRGDDSGTHAKEISIWQAAELDPSSNDWYISAGQGMGEVLTMADELQAYTLSDRATYLARSREGIYINILLEGDPLLFNPYGVISVNPAKNPNIQSDLADLFIIWLISLQTQEKIGQFGVAEFGQALFTPDSVPWRSR